MDNVKKHSILISEKLWSTIKEFCDVNGLKVNAYCEKLLSSSFLNVKYGDIPFGETSSSNENNKFEIPSAIMEHAKKRLLMEVEKSNEEVVIKKEETEDKKVIEKEEAPTVKVEEKVEAIENKPQQPRKRRL